MKKSVIILIGVIYIMAIAVVSFFGLQMEMFNETIYVEKVECINEDIIVTSSGNKYINIKYSSDEETNVVQLEWKVTPDNATNKSVRFVYDEESKVAEVTKFGTVIFYKKGTITVTITTTDGSAKNETIKITAM